MKNYSITFEIEPIVKLACLCTDCKNNLYLYGEAACNLKHIEIIENHQCMQYEKREEKP